MVVKGFQLPAAFVELVGEGGINADNPSQLQAAYPRSPVPITPSAITLGRCSLSSFFMSLRSLPGSRVSGLGYRVQAFRSGKVNDGPERLTGYPRSG